MGCDLPSSIASTGDNAPVKSAPVRKAMIISVATRGVWLPSRPGLCEGAIGVPLLPVRSTVRLRLWSEQWLDKRSAIGFIPASSATS